MAPVIEELKHLPDDDIRAMANYLASLNDGPARGRGEQVCRTHYNVDGACREHANSATARLYEGACAVCHEPGAALVNRGPALGLSSKLHAAGPTNALRLLLDGGGHASGSMPGFAAALDDRQLVDLTRYLRGRFAPGSARMARDRRNVEHRSGVICSVKAQDKSDAANTGRYLDTRRIGAHYRLYTNDNGCR